MAHEDLIQVAVAYADSVNAIVTMVCVFLTEYFTCRIRSTSRRG